MFLNRCIHCHSHCFCNCHDLYLSNSQDYTYEIEPSFRNKYETAKFRSTYSNAYEGDTMTSFSDNWKYAQPLNNNQLNVDDNINRNYFGNELLQQKQQYCTTYQQDSNRYQLDQLNDQKQKEEGQDIDQLMKENERLKELHREIPQDGLNDDALRKNPLSQPLQNNQQSLQPQNSEDPFKTALFNETQKGKEKVDPYKDTLDESLKFIKFVASKEKIPYIDDGFYIQNKEPFKQLLNSLALSLYNKKTNPLKPNEDQNKKQFEKAVNVIRNDQNPLLHQQKNELGKYPKNDNKMFEVLPNQNIQINKMPLNKGNINPQQMNDRAKGIEQKPKPNNEDLNNNNMRPNQQHQEDMRKQKDIPKSTKGQPLNVKPISRENYEKVTRANPENIYYQSFKDKQPDQFKAKNKLQGKPSQIPNTGNPSDISKDKNKPDYFPYQNQNYNQINQNRPNSQLNNQRPLSQNTNAQKNMQDFQFQKIDFLRGSQKNGYNSPSRDCFACNVKCNVSSTGYSPMTYSPYGDRKKRRAVTPIKNYLS